MLRYLLNRFKIFFDFENKMATTAKGLLKVKSKMAAGKGGSDSRTKDGGGKRGLRFQDNFHSVQECPFSIY